MILKASQKRALNMKEFIENILFCNLLTTFHEHIITTLIQMYSEK